MDGKDGRDGIDGRNGKDFDKLKHIGFWGVGKSALEGELTTHDGCLWIALSDTSDTPGHESKDWQLAARKGSDGQRGKNGKDFTPPTPIKLDDK